MEWDIKMYEASREGEPAARQSETKNMNEWEKHISDLTGKPSAPAAADTDPGGSASPKRKIRIPRQRLHQKQKLRLSFPLRHRSNITRIRERIPIDQRVAIVQREVSPRRHATFTSRRRMAPPGANVNSAIRMLFMKSGRSGRKIKEDHLGTADEEVDQAVVVEVDQVVTRIRSKEEQLPQGSKVAIASCGCRMDHVNMGTRAGTSTTRSSKVQKRRVSPRPLRP